MKVRFWMILLPVLIIDQISKWLIVSGLPVGDSQPLLGQFLFLTYVQNRGAAFGILQGHSWFFLLSALLVVIGFTYYNMRYPAAKSVQLWMGLIAGGAVGNFIDRWRYGYVVDFLDLRWWPVFNIADAAIVVGGILLVLHTLVQVREGDKHAES